MYPSIVPLLHCITCGCPLEIACVNKSLASGDITTGVLTCSNDHTWPIEAGVLVLSREDAPSDPWTRTYPTYADYAAARATARRAAVTDVRDDVAPLLERLPEPMVGPMLEVATGQGGLLCNLLPRLDPDVEVVSVDMSRTIQTYNRRYLVEQGADRKVSFIACDATNLPLRAGVIANAVALGLGNMLDQLRMGVIEVGRVAVPGGRFLFTHMYVDEDSEGWRVVTKLMAELGKKDYRFLGLEDAFLEMMCDSPFRGCNVEVTGEVVGDPDRDLSTGIFPYPNEKVRELIVTAVKPG